MGAASLYDLGELRAGTLEVIVAARREDIAQAQRLRYRVFVEEMGAKSTPEMARTSRDADAFDAVCDHLLVIDHQPEGGYRIVGTYRMLRRSGMEKIGRFYTEAEYDIAAIRAYAGEILEVGRSCVDPAYRSRAVMQLLWRGIGAYVAAFDVALLFGCASFPGTDAAAHAEALSYLHHHHLAPEEIRPVALTDRYEEMNRLPKDAFDAKRAFAALPPLIKGYLRLGGFVGHGAVIDHEYNTTDVSIVVKTDRVSGKYAERYGTQSLRQKDVP